MAPHETRDTSDPIGQAEYRVDAGFLIGYLILYLGLLVFQWDARYVILGVSVELDGRGVRASFEGEPIASHQAFWFAWSQFNPDTELWLP